MSIEISQLNKQYGNSIVLQSLNLSIKEGSIFGLLGPNGAGKTTLVSILNFLVKADSGKIKIFGKELIENKKYIQSISSFVPQSYAFYPNLTAYENLEFFASIYGLKKIALKEAIKYAIKATSLEKYKNKQAFSFSGGLKRRLNIAIGLLNNPKILYLDEPTVGIDPQSRKYILDVIKGINKEKKTTIIYTSHYMDEIEYLCDEIAILDKNKIILQEKKETLLYKNSLVSIKLSNGESKDIDIKKNYTEFVNYISELKNSSLEIKNIDFGKNSLEEMFLEITKQDLRD